ncbi:hypothetical protein EKO27_g10651 [Xylaria grammica]|uniref:Lysine-specific metallo-endopeptidase domain-containing protein n=1 Tax=Xylaria grammica TaxID=363999 RepID=A0A439CQL3_9PEZI|nr:hypothetical protein EKO27_g10651 [Xylaria grammica]
MFPLRHFLCCVLLFSVGTLVSALSITDLFEISFDEDVAGNCEAEGAGRFARYIKEGISLAMAGIDFVNAATDSSDELHVQAKRLGTEWFRNPDSDDYESILIYYEKVLDWLQNNGPNDDGDNPLKPYLFCGDSWALRKSLQDPLFGTDGKPVRDNNGDVVLIGDNSDMLNAQSEQAKATRQAVYPYWSERLSGYVWAPAFGPLPTDGYCAQPKAYGFCFTPSSQPLIGHSWISLCDYSFTDLVLGQPKCNVVEKNDFRENVAPEGAGNINDVTPESATFFHELFHLLYGAAETIPPDTPDRKEVYGTWQILGQEPLEGATNGEKMESYQALANPETYTQVAVAFYYTKTLPLADGRRQEFYTGFCTVQDDV